MAANAVTTRSIGGDLTASPPGAKRFVQVKITPSTSYPTGGEVITAAQVGLNSIESAIANSTTGALSKLVAVLPQAGNASVKFQLFVAATGAEVANAVDVSSFTFDATIYGT